MSDIIVRIPKSNVRHFYDDKCNSDTAFWRFRAKPRLLRTGDFIWFTRPAGVVGGAEVTAISKAGDGDIDSPDPEGKFNALWRGDETVLFVPAIAKINYGQQGYRYVTPGEQRLLRKAFRRQAQ